MPGKFSIWLHVVLQTVSNTSHASHHAKKNHPLTHPLTHTRHPIPVFPLVQAELAAMVRKSGDLAVRLRESEKAHAGLQQESSSSTSELTAAITALKEEKTHALEAASAAKDELRTLGAAHAKLVLRSLPSDCLLLFVLFSCVTVEKQRWSYASTWAFQHVANPLVLFLSGVAVAVLLGVCVYMRYICILYTYYILGRGACDFKERERSDRCTVGINGTSQEDVSRSSSRESEQVRR